MFFTFKIDNFKMQVLLRLHEQWRKCLKLIFQLNVQFKGEGYRWESGMSCTYKVLKFGFIGATKGFYIDWPLGVSAL